MVDKHGFIRHAHADSLRLLVVLTQHQAPNLFGHAFKQFIACLDGHITFFNQLIEQNFDINFVVRAVDARRVVNSIGEHHAAILSELNATELGHAEVTALANDFTAQLLAVDAQTIVGLVADLIVAFCFGFDVSADTAVPQQFDWRF